MLETKRDSSNGASADGDRAEVPAPYYHVDPSWFADKQLSFDAVVRARMCEGCRAKLGTAVEERVPVFDRVSGRMQFEVRRTDYGTDPLKVIREHCGRAKNYIHRDLPTLEAVFRILLANGNTPMTLEHVREQLAEWCPGGGCQWLLLPLETMERLVQNDRFYGLSAAPLPTRKPER